MTEQSNFIFSTGDKDPLKIETKERRFIGIDMAKAGADRTVINRPLGCLLTYDAYNGDYDCGYNTVLLCEDCKYGGGRKDPSAFCNTNK